MSSIGRASPWAAILAIVACGIFAGWQSGGIRPGDINWPAATNCNQTGYPYVPKDGQCEAPGTAGNPAGSDTWVQYNNAGIFGAQAAFSVNKLNGALSAPSLVANALWYSTSGAPVDPNDGSDSTAGLQAAINANESGSATGGNALFIPPGHYKLSGSLTISNDYYFRMYGAGKTGTILDCSQAGCSGVPIIFCSGCYSPTFEHFACWGNTSNPPHACIESYVPASPTVSSQHMTVRDVRITGPTQTAANFTYGITWEHASGNDLNNDTAFIENVDVAAGSVACYLITGTNSEWHHFIGGYVNQCPQAFHVNSGQFYSIGQNLQPTTVLADFEPALSGDTGYREVSYFDSTSGETAPMIFKTSSTNGPPGVTITSPNLTTGDSEGDPIINYLASDQAYANLTISGGRIQTSAGGSIVVTPTNSTVDIGSVVSLGATTVSYGGSLFSHSNRWQGGSAPTFTSTNPSSQGAFCEIQDRASNSPQYIADSCPNMSVAYAATAGAVTGGGNIAAGNLTVAGTAQVTGNIGVNITPLSTTQLYLNPPGTDTNGVYLSSSNLAVNGHAFALTGALGFYEDYVMSGTGAPTLEGKSNGMQTTWYSGNETGQTAQVKGSTGAASFAQLNQTASGDFAGSCTMSSGACTAQSFGAAFNSAPVCTCSWNGTGTLTGGLKCPSTTSTVTPASSVGTDTAQVNWICAGHPN